MTIFLKLDFFEQNFSEEQVTKKTSPTFDRIDSLKNVDDENVTKKILNTQISEKHSKILGRKSRTNLGGNSPMVMLMILNN